MGCVLAVGVALRRTLIWGVVLLVVVSALGVLLLLARWLYVKWLTAPPRRKDFSMAALEALRDGGQISQAEFRELRRTALGLGSTPSQEGESGEKDKSQSSADTKVDDGMKEAEDG